MRRIGSIIAREGLIIVSFLLLLLIALFLERTSGDQISDYKNRGEVVEVYTKTVFSEPAEHIIKGGGKYSITRISVPTGVSVMFPRETSKGVMTAAIQRDFPDLTNIDPIVEDNQGAEKIDRLYDREGNRIFIDLYYKIPWKKVELFLVLVYCVSLLVRAIVWALQARKAKTEVP